jgi:hypothetical protein
VLKSESPSLLEPSRPVMGLLYLYLYMRVTCFGLYLGLSQACKYKNLIREHITKSKGPFLNVTIFIVLKRRIYKKKYNIAITKI